MGKKILVKKFGELPAFKLNESIESKFKNEYKKTLKSLIIDISSEALKNGSKNVF